MTALRHRVSAVLARYGEPFTVGVTAAIGIFRPLSLDTARTLLTDSELVAADRPLWVGYVPHDDPSSVSASIHWNGATLAVLRIVELRVRGIVVGKVLVVG